MELRKQKTITSTTQDPERSEERQEKDAKRQAYRAPEVALVGKANQLIAGLAEGDSYDTNGWYDWLYD